MQFDTKKAARSKSKSTSDKLTSASIAEQTNAFLKSGGHIKKIRSGVRDEEVGKEPIKIGK